ncbi:MAG TPA: hypothetical protein DCY26_08195 [Hyphomonas sp.]|nr:hypothetical protein [Hyphomonas sp.]
METCASGFVTDVKSDTKLKATSPSFLRRALALVLSTLAFTFTLSAQEPKRTFDVPAGEAEQTLKQFATQAQREIVFAPDQVAGLKTNPVQGEFAPGVALDLMLADTGLTATQDTKTGAFAVRRDTRPNGPRAAPVEKTARPESKSRVEDGAVVLDDYQVTGSRMRLNSGDQPMQPVLIFSSLDIERTGAANLGQLFQYIPAITSYTTGIGTETVNGSTGSGNTLGQVGVRTSAQLRSGSQTETLLLVDGKRVPLTGVRSSGGNGYDLGGIPLSAIDRVEVLLDGASAIYGADAINGVINVILKKRYSGTEVRLNYDNTFDKDAALKTASITHGFATGKWSGLLTVSGSENNIMLMTDRRLTSTYDRTVFGGITNQSQPTLFAEGNGSVGAASGNLPGTTVPRVSIPANYAGGAITAAEYAAAPAPVGGVTPGRQGAVNYAREKAVYARLGYEFSDHFNVTGVARIGRKSYHDNGLWRRVENVTIPAGYPGNPFGVPVRLSKTFYDLPPIYNGSETENVEFSLSAEGKLIGDWRYATNISYVEGRNAMTPTALVGAGGSFGINVAPTAQFTARLNAEIAAGRQPRLIYDSNTQSPNAAGALDPFFVSTTQTKLVDLNRTWTYSAQADGTLFSLPAGDIKAVVGAELREEYVDFPGAVGGQVWPVIPQRDVVSVFAEARIPLIGERQRLPLLHQLDLNLAARTEEYSDFGRSTTPRYGVAWRPFKPLLVRASYGEGFLAPQLYRVAEQSATITFPPNFIALLFPGATDLSRGNAPIVGPLDQLSGGNPNLKPQRSESWTYGVVMDVPRVTGLSLSFDYYENDLTDGFGNIASIMDRQRFAPETIFRGPKLPTDPANWLGPITGYDGRVINISSSRSAGYSYGLRYQRRTHLGDFSLSLMGEKTLKREERILPNSALTASVNKRYVPQRATLALSWMRGAWDAGVAGVYGGKAWTDSSNVNIAPSRYTDDVMRWDANVAYDFGRRAGFGAQGDSWWKRALRDTKVRVTIINLFDTEPPLNVNGSFSSSVIDPRLRRYIIDVTKRF